MSDIERLENTGHMVLNAPDPPAEAKTAVILGVARGGTTLVAAILQALGVYMGDRLGPVLEDTALSEAIEGADLATLDDLIAARNRRFRVWGWKRPAALRTADTWQPRLRHPHIIAVYRDPFAIANRNRISMLGNPLQGIRRANRELRNLTDFIAASELPLLVCSYEKAMLSPNSFIPAVDRFLGLGAEARWPRARSAVGTNDSYLRTTRITESEGYVDVITSEHCAGWACYTRRPHHTARVIVSVNGRPVGATEANSLRNDVRDAGFHPTGECGFEFHWPEGEVPGAGDQVEVWVEGDIAPLSGTRTL